VPPTEGPSGDGADSGAPTQAGSEPHTAAPEQTVARTTTQGSRELHTGGDEKAVVATGTAPRAASASAGSGDLAPATDATPRQVATRNARALGVHGLPLAALGGAAANALIPHAPIDPPPAQLAALRDRLQTIGSGAIAVSLRDHRVLLTLLCDQLFEHDRAELSERGTQVVRGLSRLLAGDHGHAYNVAVDRERAFELLSNLAIAGLPPERVDLALRKRDSAIDVVEVEWIDVKETP